MSHLKKLFRYETWASRRLLERLRQLNDFDPALRKLFAHTQIGLKVWILRLRGKDSRGVPIWPDLTLDECEDLIHENETAYAELLASSPEELLARTVSYTNQHGLWYVAPLRLKQSSVSTDSDQP